MTNLMQAMCQMTSRCVYISSHMGSYLHVAFSMVHLSRIALQKSGMRLFARFTQFCVSFLLEDFSALVLRYSMRHPVAQIVRLPSALENIAAVEVDISRICS